MNQNDTARNSDEPQAFDGLMVIPVIGEIPRDFFRRPEKGFLARPKPDENLLFFHSNSGRFVPINNELLIALAELQAMRSREKVPQKYIHGQEQAIPRLKRKSSKLPNREIYEIIMDGRLRLVLLLDTLGGSPFGVDNVRDVAQFVKHNHGGIVAYGAADICSGGANIFMEADVGHRYLIENSLLMFHPPRRPKTTPDGEDIPEAVKEGAWRRIREILLHDTIPALRPVMEKRLQKAVDEELQEGDRRIDFFGVEAEIFGLGQIAKSLRKIFEEVHCVETNMYQGTRIETFFAATDTQ